MSEAIRERGETPFEEAGDGIVLCFTNSDLKQIQAKYGKGWVTSATDDLINGRMDFELLEMLVEKGAKKDRKPVTVDQKKLDAMPVGDLCERLVDALHIAIHGRTFKQHVEHVMKLVEEATAKGEPPPSLLSPDMTTSTISEGSPSGPASE